MLYRRYFGRTNLQMPVSSCGGMHDRYRWQNIPLIDIPQANQQNLETTIEQAFALEIKHIETARGYGSSKIQFGPILPKSDCLFCLSHSQVHTLSLGAAKLTNFEEHLKILPLIENADEILPPIFRSSSKERVVEKLTPFEHRETWRTLIQNMENRIASS